MFELVEYTHPSSLKLLLLPTTLPLEDEGKFLASGESVLGLFLRKFCLGFHHQGFSEMLKFVDSFIDAYDRHMSEEGEGVSAGAMNDTIHFTRSNVSDASSRIIETVGRFGVPSVDVSEQEECLLQSKKIFPDMPSPHLATHLLALRKRDFTESERSLCHYFETRLANDKNLNITCSYLAVAAANMHISFGHWLRGKRLHEEALKKALESDSRSALSHVKLTHRMLGESTKSLCFGNADVFSSMDVSLHSAVAELRAKFWTMVDSGSDPRELLLLYMNSSIVMTPVNFTLCMLDLSALWSLYGYPILHTALLQCIVNAECLQPSMNSDFVLTTAFASLIKVFNSVGAVENALQLAHNAEQVLCRFSEKSQLRYAGLQTELEQCLRSGIDFSRCERLINALALGNQLEAAIYQAELEKCRGNNVTSHDLLQRVIHTITHKLTQPWVAVSNEFMHDSAQPFGCTAPDKCIRAGSRIELAQIALRAYFSLMELFMSINMHRKALDVLKNAEALAEKYRLQTGHTLAIFLQYAVTTSHELEPHDAQRLNRTMSKLLQQSDFPCQFRARVYSSRVRILLDKSKSGTESYLSSHFKLLVSALHFFRSIDDRQQILDLLLLLAAALDATDNLVERNLVSRAFLELQNEHQFGSFGTRYSGVRVF